MSNFKKGLQERAQNKIFWTSLISILILTLQYIGQLFGIEIDLSGKEDIILKLVNCIFAMLAVLGVIIEPTTPGIKDGKNTSTEAVEETKVIDEFDLD